ncbi:hypothetical protein PoB_007357300 [Plakobranchus ocellatus]|uniref:Uncharacterized protein n=1 Tax=Plakobranchus ocellatus TaxID=259542 RepID=A0AAV4DRX3_9GAST|nr:hypothetical protein PoB_007357300 [Plakobranchus ocellatus]
MIHHSFPLCDLQGSFTLVTGLSPIRPPTPWPDEGITNLGSPLPELKPAKEINVSKNFRADCLALLQPLSPPPHPQHLLNHLVWIQDRNKSILNLLERPSRSSGLTGRQPQTKRMGGIRMIQQSRIQSSRRPLGSKPDLSLLHSILTIHRVKLSMIDSIPAWFTTNGLISC